MMPKKMTLLVLCSAVLLTTTLSGCTNNSNATTQTTVNTTTKEEATDSFYTTDTVHTIDLNVDEDTLSEMLTAYQKDGSKNWIEATVTIDGETFEKVGLKLKGNSTLKNITKQTTDDIKAEELPWVIRLDKYVDDQAYKGRSRFVVRGNNTESSLNEAVSLTMLTEAGVETEDSAFTRFAVNGSNETLRLVIDVPDDDAWTESHFGTNGLLYKADSEGDYTYRGEDAASYDGVFEQKYGEEDMTPLITFLDFINNSTDEAFEEQLPDYFDVDAFATYLVMQDLVANDDAIDGPGNNGYLYYDTETKQMTVVAWDQNLSFGAMGAQGEGGPMGENDGAGGPPADRAEGGKSEMTPPDETIESGEMPEGMTPPDGTFESGETPPEMPEGMTGENKGGAMGGKENALVTRFKSSETFSALIAKKKTEYTESIIDSGFAQTTLESYQKLLADEASDLIETKNLTSEASTIAKYLTGEMDKTTKESTAKSTEKETTSTSE